MDETILTSKETIRGKLKNPEQTCSYMMYPPIAAMRTDLEQGTMKLLYGESSDVCFYGINDINNETCYIFNAHTEDGIPVDWWTAGPEDEILERRHLKYGFKLRDVNKKSKNLVQTGKNIIDMLKDIRTERAPQWATSSMTVCLCWITSVCNLTLIASNIESWGQVWDGVNAKRIYKLPDHYFLYYPWPPLFSTLLMLPRSKFIRRISGLTTNSNLAIQPWEPNTLEHALDQSPEFYEHLISSRKGGIPNPATTLVCKPPDLTKKITYELEKFDFIYPDKARFIYPEDINLSFEEIIKGVFLDVNFEFPIDKKVTPENVISLGWGRSTLL